MLRDLVTFKKCYREFGNAFGNIFKSVTGFRFKKCYREFGNAFGNIFKSVTGFRNDLIVKQDFA